VKKANLIGSLLFLGVFIAILVWAWENTSLKDVLKDSVNTWLDYIKGGLNTWQQLASGEYYEEESTYVPPPKNVTNNTSSYTPDPILDFHCDGPVVFHITNIDGKIQFVPEEKNQYKIMHLYITINPELKLKDISISSTSGADNYFNIVLKKDNNGNYYLNISIKKDLKSYPQEETDYVIRFEVELEKKFNEIFPLLIKNRKWGYSKQLHLGSPTYIMGDNFYVKPKQWEYEIDNESDEKLTLELEASAYDNNFNINIDKVEILGKNSNNIKISSEENSKKLTIKIPRREIEYYAILPIHIEGTMTYKDSNLEDPTTCYIAVEEK